MKIHFRNTSTVPHSWNDELTLTDIHHVFFSWTTRQLERMQWQHTFSFCAVNIFLFYFFLAPIPSLWSCLSADGKDFAVKLDLNIEFPWSLSYLWVFLILALFEVMISVPLFGISRIKCVLSTQVKSVKTGSVFWTIGCCLSYFYMVSFHWIFSVCVLHLISVNGTW